MEDVGRRRERGDVEQSKTAVQNFPARPCCRALPRGAWLHGTFLSNCLHEHRYVAAYYFDSNKDRLLNYIKFILYFK
jgi:hypothetical protein